MDINLVIQSIIAIIMLISVVAIYRTIKSNQNLNQKIIFNEVVKQERELRIKLQEYKEVINAIELQETMIRDYINLDKSKKLKLDYDTLLFNYYEYLAICLYKQLINEDDAKLYFKILLKSVREYFETSSLFKEKYSKREHYPGIRWLFKQWGI